MTREQIDALILSLEQASRKNPRLYVARVIGLVFLAYAYLLLILFGSLALCILMIVMVVFAPVTIKLGLVGLILFGGIFIAVARGLWVKLNPPIGRAITRGEVPKLFDLLDELRAALNCAPFHQVLLIGDVNAAVVQIPRLGILGWHRNYLLLGLPLMQSLGPDEFKAVLAHEFTHSSRGHGRFGNWLYRTRRTWEQTIQLMAKRRLRFGSVLFKFLRWFWPRFHAHAFVLSRTNEYEADACSVRLAGPDATSRALIRSRIDGALLHQKFWPDTFSRANTEKQPPADIGLALNQALKNGAAPDDAALWLRQAFLTETNNGDTHPCLKDRLRAIGRLPAGIEQGNFPATPPPKPTQTAAEFYLGDQEAALTRAMSEAWAKAITPKWTERHNQAQKIAGELQNLEKPADPTAPPEPPPVPKTLWEKARKLIELNGDAAAIPTLEQIITLDPKHAAANFILGRHHLHTDDPRGVAFIETAIAADPALTRDGCNLLYAHFNRTGQRDKLRPLENRVDEFQKVATAAQQERARITVADTFIPHELTPNQIVSLREAFVTEKDIGSAAVAQKQVTLFPNNKCFVVSLQLKVPWWTVRSSSASALVAQRIAKKIRLPGNALVIINEKNLKPLGNKVCQVPSAIIYQRTP